MDNRAYGDSIGTSHRLGWVSGCLILLLPLIIFLACAYSSKIIGIFEPNPTQDLSLFPTSTTESSVANLATPISVPRITLESLLGKVVCPDSDKIPLYPLPGEAEAGYLTDCAKAIEESPDGLWLRVEDGWVSRFRVIKEGGISEMDIVRSHGQILETPYIGEEQGSRFEQVACEGGCTSHILGCDIKGNISYQTGEKIYHVPSGEWYSETAINTSYGERWFCTESEAREAGWRRSSR